jgi:hypothetical protein
LFSKIVVVAGAKAGPNELDPGSGFSDEGGSMVGVFSIPVPDITCNPFIFQKETSHYVTDASFMIRSINRCVLADA